MLGVSALRVKAQAPYVIWHHARMPNAAGKSAFHANLKALTDQAPSVNAWAKARGLEQPTIQRLVNGADPRLSMILRIADACGLEPWALLIDGLDPKNPPVVRGASESERQLWSKIDGLLRDLGQLRDAASTGPGSL